MLHHVFSPGSEFRLDGWDIEIELKQIGGIVALFDRSESVVAFRAKDALNAELLIGSQVVVERFSSEGGR